MLRRTALALTLVGLTVVAGCKRPSSVPPPDAAASDAGPPSAPVDPRLPGLAFVYVPASAVMNRRFEVHVRLNDQKGERIFRDYQTPVTIEAEGGGSLGGTLTRTPTGGLVRFDDLRYDRWEPVRLIVKAPGRAPLSTSVPVTFRPVLRFAETPPYRVRAGGPLGKLALEVVDGRGNPISTDLSLTLTSTDPQMIVPGGASRRAVNGRVSFEGVTLAGTGPVTLRFTAEGVDPLVHGVTAFGTKRVETIWLPGARAGAFYRTRVPTTGSDVRLTAGALPKGLRLTPEGELSGTPTRPGHARFEVVAVEQGGTAVSLVELTVFPKGDAPEPVVGTLDRLNVDGPWPVQTWDTRMPVPARQVTVDARVFHPRTDAGARRRFPVVVFHHGLAPVTPQNPRIYDRFAPLLSRWASYGFIVLTIDAVDLVRVGDGYTELTYANLKLMSENQRAAIAYLRLQDTVRDAPLAGRIDGSRVIVAGHSRGAAASLMTLRSEPLAVGALLLKPTDPMITTGGESLWRGPLPPKPILLSIAEKDTDTVYPVGDFLFERRSGPMSAHTILGSVHGFSCDERCTLDEEDQPEITRDQDWAISNAYAVAFLKYVADGDVTYAPLLFGPPALSTKLSPRGVLMRADRGAASIVVDDFQDAVNGRNRLGLPSTSAGTSWTEDAPWVRDALTRVPEMYAFTRQVYAKSEVAARSQSHVIEWKKPGALFTSDLGGLDVRGRGAFVFRARSDTRLPPRAITLRFTDGPGRVASLPGEQHAGEQGIGDRFSDVIVPLVRLQQAGLDLNDLTRFELILDGAGRIVIDDLRFE